MLIISGGKIGQYQDLNTIEIYSPVIDTQNCTIPVITQTVAGHSIDEKLLCASNKCWTLNGQEWEDAYSLSKTRGYHMSWKSSKGVHLLGGGSSDIQNTSVLLKDAQVTDDFGLSEQFE